MIKNSCGTRRLLWLAGLVVALALLASCSSGNSTDGLRVYPKAMGAADEASAISVGGPAASRCRICAIRSVEWCGMSQRVSNHQVQPASAQGIT